jgi:hypothetical protein
MEGAENPTRLGLELESGSIQIKGHGQWLLLYFLPSQCMSGQLMGLPK